MVSVDGADGVVVSSCDGAVSICGSVDAAELCAFGAKYTCLRSVLGCSWTVGLLVCCGVSD